MIREVEQAPAPPPREVAAPITVAREEQPRVRTVVARAPDQTTADDVKRVEEDEQLLLRELGDTVRDALVPDRIAEALVQRLQRAVSDGIRGVLRDRLARDLRDALRDAALRGGDGIRASALLNQRVSDAIEDRTRELLSEATPTLLRERLPEALRAAVSDTTFGRRYGPAAVDDVAERMQSVVNKAIRQRLRDGLRGVVRARLVELTRERLGEAFRSAAASGSYAADDKAQGVGAALGEAVEEAIHDRVLAAVMDRFRSIVLNSLHEAAGEHIGDGLAPSVSWVAIPRGTTPFPEWPVAGTLDRLAGIIEQPVADAIRAQLMDGLAERIETTLRDNIDQVVRERLGGAVRNAIAQQRDADRIDLDRLAEAIHYDLAEVVTGRIGDGIRARAAYAVRTRLAEVVRRGLSRTPLA